MDVGTGRSMSVDDVYQLSSVQAPPAGCFLLATPPPRSPPSQSLGRPAFDPQIRQKVGTQGRPWRYKTRLQTENGGMMVGWWDGGW